MSNNRLFFTRYQQIVVISLLLMFILGARLFVVTIVQHNKWEGEASSQNTKSVFTDAPRGNIYDRNGNVLATTKQVFTVNFNASALSTEEINDSALKLINTLKKNKDKYTDNFPIKITSSGTYYYSYIKDIRDWMKEEGFATNLSAEQSFEALRTKYHIDDSLDRYDALTELQEKHNVYPPIYVKKMVFKGDKELEYFLGKFGFTEAEIEKGVSPESCFKRLREKYKIDETLSDKEARKIFIIRNEIATNGFTKYLPIKISTGLSEKSIAYLEEASLPGVEISSESERYYPNENTASHILGYMGAISESETEYYVDEKGYSSTDLVGKAGIEAAMESKLHGTPGIKQIRINSGGQYVETIKETPAKKGSDVYLSIDIDLQKRAEKALKDAVSKHKTSRSGAVVALDVETGDVLAMASYPSYDPNIFANGISNKAWKSVQAENPRDVFSPAPLYNLATRAAIQPGSTFKPITSITALEKGLNPNQYVVDRGHIDIGGRTFGCLNWNDYRSTHGSQNLAIGIGNSCNYYFYCIGTGKDWGNGASLGYDISVDDILNTARKLGLADKTGIEIGEVVAPLPSAENKLAATQLGVRDYLYNNAHKYFPKKIANNREKLRENLYKISDWTEENPSYGDLIERLKTQTDIKDSYAEKVASDIKYDYFTQAEWGIGDQFNIAIGQGDNSYTTVQMANYLATMGNEGKRNQVSLVSAVEGEGVKVKAKAVDTGISETTLEEVFKGMRRVCTNGTLKSLYANFPVAVLGKTGTAQNQSIKQPKSEVDYIKNRLGTLNSMAGTSVSWGEVKKIMTQLMDDEPERYPTEDEAVDEACRKASDYKITKSMINSGKGSYVPFGWTMAMAPAEDPKIAVVSMLVEGDSSVYAAPITKEIISEYFDIDSKTSSDNKKDKNKEKTTSTKINNLGTNKLN